ncbi:MAG TPA: efflux RND transporter periplasmic adaptor subunit [Verrucomicrobiae bacterium]|jgi:membrane fusion protein (multidrug efflux system)|nr:efflux RND transporter periplasmic adaptor subunit [Verrucomicrobiae bacterium]
MRAKFLQALGLSGLALAVLTACHRHAESRRPDARPAAVPVTITTVTNVTWDRLVSIVGTLYPKDTATIAAQVDGSVERTLVDFGDRVMSNQDLAFIDTASYEAQLTQQAGNLTRAAATLTNARRSYERVQKLSKDEIASLADFDQARTALDQAEAEVKAARGAEVVAKLNVERSRVAAPFEGGISLRVVGRGDYVKIGSPLFEIVNDAILKFIFAVPERNASFVRKGLPVSFSVDNYPGERFTGSVYLISPAVSTATRAFNVGALVTNAEFRLKANTFARGALVVERGVPTSVVPLEAVVSFAGVTKVFRVQDGKAESRAVKAGRIRDGLQEIMEGVNLGDQVVVTGTTKLTDGMSVIIQASGRSEIEARPVQVSGTNTVAEQRHGGE